MNFFAIWSQATVVILILMSLVWLVSVLLKNASIVDPIWGFGFVLATWFYYGRSQGLPARQLLVSILVTIWGLRLSLYLFWRGWGHGEDFRYQNFRQQYGPARYWWVSFFQVFLLQGIMMWLISATLLGAHFGDAGLNWLDRTAVIVWLIGFFFETIGDWQLVQFKRDPANKGQLLTTGLWRYTRHPNYFGDACVWWSYGLFCLAAGSFVPILGSLLMTVLLVRVSGVAYLERSLKQSKPGYENYMAQTNAFFPWLPRK
jgi:steroid 5-alpha reductase family enzyme